MERLTIMTTKGAALKMADTYPDEAAARIDLMGRYRIAVDRLAAYEDTGLEPEEVEQTKLALMGQSLAEIIEFEGIPLDRMKELARAEKDGRLVVPPVPVGTDKVAYGLTDSDDGPQRIVTIECDYLEKLEIWDNPGHEVVVEVDGWEIGESDFGKTVFLTREEAEAELKKREEADNEAD